MLAAAMTRESRYPNDPWRPNTPPPAPPTVASQSWKRACLKLFFIGRFSKLAARMKLLVGEQVYQAQFGTPYPVLTQTTSSPVHPGARRVTMQNQEWILGEVIPESKSKPNLGTPSTATDPKLCDHHVHHLSFKGSNQHQKRFLCQACGTAFRRHLVEDMHPSSARPPLETDRITWGSQFGQT